jgi:hypothetical protein
MTQQAKPAPELLDALDSDPRAMGWMESFMRRMMRLMREEPPSGDRL